MPKCIIAYICDYAGAGMVDGVTKVSIEGIMEELHLPEIPYDDEHFFIVTEWRGEPGEEFIASTLFVSPKKRSRQIFETPIKIGPNGGARLMAEFHHLSIFTMAGDYRIAILSNDEPTGIGILLTVSKRTSH